MDINDFLPKADELVVELEINTGEKVHKLVNEDGTPMTVTILSPFSDEARKILNDMRDAFVSEAVKNNKKDFTSNEKEEQELKILAATTVSWNITWGGEKPELTTENVINFYRKAFWARPLIEKAKVETLNFMKD